MTRIDIDLRRDVVGGTEVTSGTLIAQRTRVRVDGGVVTYPAEIRFPLPGPVSLAALPVGEAWKLQLYAAGSTRSLYRTVLVSGEVCAWADLVDVDPGTLEPMVEPPGAAWAVEIADLTARVDALTLAPGAVYTQASPSSQWSIPHNFGRRPTVSVYGADGALYLADVTVEPNLVVVTFAQPTAGSAVLT